MKCPTQLGTLSYMECIKHDFQGLGSLENLMLLKDLIATLIHLNAHLSMHSDWCHYCATRWNKKRKWLPYGSFCLHRWLRVLANSGWDYESQEDNARAHESTLLYPFFYFFLFNTLLYVDVKFFNEWTKSKQFSIASISSLMPTIYLMEGRRPKQSRQFRSVPILVWPFSGTFWSSDQISIKKIKI